MIALQTLIWKEWRENVGWAALGFMRVSLLMVRAAVTTFLIPPTDPQFNIFANHEFISLLLGPLFAGLLGYTQIKCEGHGDYRALLMHRPVSRTFIFWGKVLGGVSLYFGAFMLPFIGLAIWTSVQSRVIMPSQWDNMLEPVGLILVSCLYYLAGIMVAARRARWYGSRFLPIPAVVLMFLLALSPGLLYDADHYAEIALALVFGIFGLAAWGNVLGDGNYVRMPRIVKISQGIILYFGLLVPIMSIAGLFFLTQSATVMGPALRSNPKVQKLMKEREGLSAEEKEKLDEKVSEKEVQEIFQPWGDWFTSTPWFLRSIPTIATSPIVAMGALETVKQMSKDRPGAERELLLKDLKTLVVSTFAVGFLFSIPTFFLARRACLSQGEALGWSAGTIALGINGPLILLCLHDWPLLEACPHCGKQRSIHSEKCEHCAAPATKPKADATSISENNDDLELSAMLMLDN